ncbi:hypothetical protein DRF65_23500 [Chryseobacterium pennae]|uniref:Uncharacterized protein n=1 Tax=Chryseobacterium pennae TaxID=2258962 RepID=A0A3D9C1Z7_9FLAO|nr:hypothetical protein [Chryseobacterium pennae]REC59880.1 hypothetical protein DRF65_23500 [Chryseobacterium pennae]
MKINPITILNILITIFLIIAIMVIVLMIKNKMNIYYISAAAMVSFLLSFILYTINKGVTMSSHTEEINKYKAKLVYHQDFFTIATYTQNQIICWSEIEAIFFISSPPLDGEYHTMEYRIFLNKKPETVRKQPLKWYDKILPEPRQEKFPMVKIDDYYNVDFNTFYPSIEKFLLTEKISSAFLNGTFGNDVKYTQKQNEIIGIPYSKPLKTTGFYKLFDRGTYADNGSLKDYRKQATEI